jgi:hypothetical protein
MGALGMGNENVTGFYFDDEWARSGHGWAELNMKGTPLPFNASDCGAENAPFSSHFVLKTIVLSRQARDNRRKG